MRTLDVEVWVKVDEQGGYALGKTAEDAAAAFDAEVETGPEYGARVVKVVLRVPAPVVPTLTGVVPAEGAGELRVA